MAGTWVEEFAKFVASISSHNALMTGGDDETVVVDGLTKPSFSKDIKDRIDGSLAELQAMVAGRATFETYTEMIAEGAPVIPSGQTTVAREVLNDDGVDAEGKTLNGLYVWDVSDSVWVLSPLSSAEIEVQEVVSEDSNEAVSSAAVFEYAAPRDMLTVVPELVSNARVGSKNTIPGWVFISGYSGNAAYGPIDVKGGIEYKLEDVTGDWSGTKALVFLNGDEQAIGYVTSGANSASFTTPADCKKIVFGIGSSSAGADFKLKQVTNQAAGYEQGPIDVSTVNLVDDGFSAEILTVDDRLNTGLIGLAKDNKAATSSMFAVNEGETYFIYMNADLPNFPLNVFDENDKCIELVDSDFNPYATPNSGYTEFTIPVGIGAVKASIRLAGGTAALANVVSGATWWVAAHSSNKNIIANKLIGKREPLNAQSVNEIVDAREHFDKVFTDKSLMVLGDSVYATQSNAEEAFFTGADGVRFATNQGVNSLYGGACSDIVRRLRPAFWTNYSSGGWTLTHSGASFGQDIHTNDEQGSYLYNLERFIFDYDNYIADPINFEKRVAPDVFMIASCINDFSNPIDAWATDADIAASGLSYDDYMEQTFMTSGNVNDTLVPLENIDLGKVAGALRYVVERIYRKFPRCHIVVITPNKTTKHSRSAQMKCVRDMSWMAERLNTQVIDLFNKGQMNMLMEYKDAVTGERDDLYLTVDGIHDYGSSAGKGYQRHGRFICNELIKEYFGLSEFVI